MWQQIQVGGGMYQSAGAGGGTDRVVRRASGAGRVARQASERWHAWRRARKAFPLAAWSYFQRFPGTKKEYALYRNANLNLTMAPAAHYANAASAGLEVALGGFEPLHTDRALLRRTVAFPKPSDRRVTAYMLKDEPLVEDYPALARAFRYIYDHDERGAIPIVDFRPNWAVPWKRWNMSYEQYVDRFIEEVNPCLLLNCHYAIMADGSSRDVFYDNIEMFRAKALERNIGLMGFSLVTPHTFPKSPQIDYRTPSESDLRWSVYSYLAYGAQGIWYYNWRIDNNGPFGDALVDFKTGEPTPTYALVAALNQEILTIGPALMKLRSKAVYHTGAQVPPGTTRYAPDRILGVERWAGDDFILGVFGNQDNTRDRDLYLMVVNKRHGPGATSASLAARAEFTPAPPLPAVHGYDPDSGRSVPLVRTKEGRVALELGGGQGVLLRLAAK